MKMIENLIDSSQANILKRFLQETVRQTFCSVQFHPGYYFRSKAPRHVYHLDQYCLLFDYSV